MSQWFEEENGKPTMAASLSQFPSDIACRQKVLAFVGKPGEA